MLNKFMAMRMKIFILVMILCSFACPVLAGELKAISGDEKISLLEPVQVNLPVQIENVKSSAESDHKPGEFIVMFRENILEGSGDSHDSRVKNFVQALGVEIISTYPALSKQAGQVFALVHADSKSESEMLEELQANPNVLGVSLNYKTHALTTPNDKYYSQLWGMSAIKADKLWDQGYTGASDIYVAVLDSGISYNHEDLAANFESSGFSKNFSSTSNYSDGDGHGTHVSGTIAGVGNNSIGVAGVNWKAKLIAVKVLDNNGNGYFSWILNGLNYLCELLDNHPEINLASINLSLGGYMSTSPQEMKSSNNPTWVAFKAISDKNKAVICVAAGNEKIQVGANTSKGYCYPASLIDIDNMIVVAASDNNSSYSRSSFSNYSTQYVDVAAPGRGIYSSLLNNSYGNLSGTSMATPHVTGAAALLRSIFPNTTASEIKSAIINGANKNYATSYTKYGFLDVKSAFDILSKNNTPSSLAPVIETDSLDDATIDNYYSATLSASGAKYITWSLESSYKDLPDGMNFSSMGIISGTPTTAGTYTFTVKASNLYGSAKKTLTLTVKDIDKAPIIQNSELPDGSIQEFYSASLYASGTSPITWKISSGSLPTGLNLDSSTGIISGAPSKAGTFEFAVKASNNTGSDTKNYSLTIEGIAPQILTLMSLRNAVLGQYYSEKLEAIGTGPVTWNLYSGSLPNGLKLNSSTGVISGTPRESSDSSYNFVITASNAEGYDYVEFSMYVDDMSTKSGINIKTETLPYVFYNQPYSAKLEATGTKPITWSIIEGSLPDGITLESDGTLTGLGSYGEGFTEIKVQASNSKGSITKNLTVRYTALQTPQEFVRESLPDGIKGSEYNQYLYMIGYSPFYFDVKEGTLPPGLILNSEGYITGTPTKSGSYTFTIRGTCQYSGWGLYDIKTFTITIRDNEKKPSITSKNLPDGTNGLIYNTGLKYSGTHDISWTCDYDSLPPGLYLAGDGDLISGIPTQAGTYTFNIYAENSAGSASQLLTIKINDVPNYANHEILTDSDLGTYSQGSYYAFTFSADEGATWTHTDGNIPDGMTFYKYGILSGRPAETGEFNFTVSALFDDDISVSKNFKIVISSAAPVIESNSKLDPGTDGESYNYELKASGAESFTWELKSGSLPEGLELDSTGIISGIPTQTGKFNFIIQVNNSYGSDSQNFTLTIKAAAPVITSETLSDGKIGEYYNSELQATGSTPLKWSISGQFPKGLKLNASTGQITGTPTKAGTFTFTAKVKNSGGNDSKSFTIEISLPDNAVPVINDDSLINPEAGKYYSHQFTAAGINPITWTKIAGQIPSGLKLNKSGLLAGTPKQSGEFDFTIKAANKYGNDTKSYTLRITPVIITSKLNSGIFNKSYSAALSVQGSKSNIIWQVVSGSLPEGLKLNESTGKISGKPTSSGEYNFTVRAEVENVTPALYDEQSYTIKITGIAPKINTSSLKKGTINKDYSAAIKTTGSTPMNLEISGLPEGLSLNYDSETGQGTITGTPTECGNFSVKLTASNETNTTSRTFNLVINNIKPSFTSLSLPDAIIGQSYSANIQATGAAKGDNLSFTLSWSGKNIGGFTLDNSDASITGTPAETSGKNFNAPGTYRVKVIAKNSAGTKSKTFKIKLNAAQITEVESAQKVLSESEFESESESLSSIFPDNQESNAQKLSFLENFAGNNKDFTAGDLAEIDGKKYIIAAVIAPVKSLESGQFDFNVELSEKAPTGAKLTWLACPYDSEDSQDDEIADFYDETGKEIFTVPESHSITVSPWLRKCVIYEPLILAEIME
ncbi:MAG: putative Ig domain-containing protein [Synergistaceae bacterium]|nr:putative Ig domain-containing protein [Synergistaceae bacterium]